jgi:DNA-binding transcriptional MerR regulator
MSSTRRGRFLSIGELAERTGVARTALRYYDELALVRPVDRASGRRRYTTSAIAEVGVIRLLREVGFTLTEIGSLMRAGDRASRHEMVDRKLGELTEQQRRIEVARVVLEHAQGCPSGDPLRCPRFRSVVESRLRGLPLEESHSRVH